MTNQPKKSPAKSASSKFTTRMFIPNFGYVDIGDKVTKEAKEAWENWTEVPISNYSK